MTVLEALDEAEGVHEVAAKGFVFFWPLRFTFLGRRELPENVGNMFGGAASAELGEAIAPSHCSKRL